MSILSKLSICTHTRQEFLLSSFSTQQRETYVEIRGSAGRHNSGDVRICELQGVHLRKKVRGGLCCSCERLGTFMGYVRLMHQSGSV